MEPSVRPALVWPQRGTRQGTRWRAAGANESPETPESPENLVCRASTSAHVLHTDAATAASQQKCWDPVSPSSHLPRVRSKSSQCWTNQRCSWRWTLQLRCQPSALWPTFTTHRRRTKTLFNLRASFIKRECYARQHGYANVFATHAPEPYGSVLFSRVLLGVEWLPHFEWLLITDADYFLNNFSAQQSLHRRFDATRNRHHGATLRLSLRLHPTPAGRLPLLCHPRAQHSPLGRELLETWAQLRHSCQQAVQWPEQQRLFLSAARAVQRYHGLPTTPESDCTRECDAPPAGNRSVTHRQTEREQSTDTTQQRIVKKCFANITRHLGLRTGHDGASGFPPQPPVAWSNGECRRADAGLGISLNFGALRRNGSDYGMPRP